MPYGGYPLHVLSAPLGPINLSPIICVVVHSTQLIAGITPTACFHEVGAVKADIKARIMCTCAARAPRTQSFLSMYQQVTPLRFYTHAKFGVICSNMCENITFDHKMGPKWAFSPAKGCPSLPS